MILIKTAIVTAVLFAASMPCWAQCASESNIYTFEYSGRSYEVVKEGRDWSAAAVCAVARGGMLAEIDSAGEQIAVYNEVKNNAGINLAWTVAPDGGNASYVWLGGHDFVTEGTWIWDGNGDGAGPQFWQGKSASQGGFAYGGSYTNWGNEPDDYLASQDALGLALTNWPKGTAGKWNDVRGDNLLFYIIEYTYITPVEMSLFRAAQQGGDIAVVWRTESESNNFGWDVERRLPGSDWESLGFVGVAGTTAQPQYYEYIDRTPPSGDLAYRIKQMDYDGKAAYSMISEVDFAALPTAMSLEQNHPNPFRGRTVIRYTLPEDGHVRLTVYNALGREVAVLAGGFVRAGAHEAAFDAGALPAGMYVYRLETAREVLTKTMALME